MDSPSTPNLGRTATGDVPLSPSRPLLPSSPMPISSSFVPSTHPGCVLCGLVASAASQSARGPVRDLEREEEQEESTPTSAPSSSRVRTVMVGEREIIHQDRDITVYPATGKERLCSDGRHLVLLLNQHVESVYSLGASDIPLLSHILNTAEQILGALPSSSGDTERAKRQAMRVGFVGPIMRDPQSPHAHLHAHAMLGPVDTSLPGAGLWRRNVVFGSMNWWSIEDLRAEIRESTSNNRVKSGYTDRQRAPIEKVPDAGSLSGPPNIVLSPATSGTGTPRSQTHSGLHSRASSPGSRPSDVLLHDQQEASSSSSTSRGKRRADSQPRPQPTEEDSYEAVDLGVVSRS